MESMVVIDELEALRYHKSDLEDKLADLQDYRQELIDQLGSLLNLLRAQHSLPCDSSLVKTVKSNKGSEYTTEANNSLYRSTPKTGSHCHHQDQSIFISGDGEIRQQISVREDFSLISFDKSSSIPLPLRNDLLWAADSVTSAMSSLVKVLHSEEDMKIRNTRGRQERPMSSGLYRTTTVWNNTAEMTRLMEEEHYLEALRNLRLSSDTDSDLGQEDDEVDLFTQEFQFASGEFGSQYYVDDEQSLSEFDAE